VANNSATGKTHSATENLILQKARSESGRMLSEAL